MMRGPFIVTRTVPKGYGISRILVEKGSKVLIDDNRV